MSIISIITPLYRPVREQLAEARRSLFAQRLPDGWEWEWVLQEDGPTGAGREYAGDDDPRLSHGANRHLGVSLTRNLGLARARGGLVKNLDQDDILAPGALARDIEALTAHPHVGWTTSRVLDLMPDGSTVGFDDPPAGELAPGFAFEHWRSHDYRLPVHPTTICIRRALAAAMGGWMAVPGSDDTGLLIAASTVSPGYFIGEVGLLYRKWPGQVTAAPEHNEPVERNLRMGLIEERAVALAELWGSRAVA